MLFLWPNIYFVNKSNLRWLHIVFLYRKKIRTSLAMTALVFEAKWNKNIMTAQHCFYSGPSLRAVMRSAWSWRNFILMTSRCPKLLFKINQETSGRIFSNFEGLFIVIKEDFRQKNLWFVMTEFFLFQKKAFSVILKILSLESFWNTVR